MTMTLILKLNVFEKLSSFLYNLYFIIMTETMLCELQSCRRGFSVSAVYLI